MDDTDSVMWLRRVAHLTTERNTERAAREQAERERDGLRRSVADLSEERSVLYTERRDLHRQRDTLRAELAAARRVIEAQGYLSNEPHDPRASTFFHEAWQAYNLVRTDCDDEDAVRRPAGGEG